MNRRTFLRTTALAGTAFALAPRRSLAATAHPARKPNLLFIITDEQRADTLACYDNRIVRAPALNALAAQSVIFDQAYVSQPVSTPSRGTLLTGLYPHQSGITSNSTLLRPQQPIYTELLADPDYRTGHIGTWNMGDEIFPQHGFEEWHAVDDQYPQDYGPARDKNAKSSYWHYLTERGYKTDQANGNFSRPFALKLPLEHGKPGYMATKAIDFLQRNRSNPFVLQVSYHEPHTPYQSPLTHLYADDKIALPDTYHNDGNPDEIPWRLRIRQQSDASNKLNNRPAEKIADTIRAYYANITCVDRSVERILAELDRLGLADNTIVIFTSDHGNMLGAHRLWEKEVPYQESIRVPLLMRIPGVRGGTHFASPWSNIDMVPTLLGLLNKKSPDHLPGLNRTDEITGRAPEKPKPAIIEWNPNCRPGSTTKPEGKYSHAAAHPHLIKYLDESSRTVIMPDGWKFTMSDIDKCSLYNLTADPTETRNLFYQPANRADWRRTLNELKRWQKRTADPLVLPNY